MCEPSPPWRTRDTVALVCEVLVTLANLTMALDSIGRIFGG